MFLVAVRSRFSTLGTSRRWKWGPMRKVVAYELLSLDGVAEDPDTFISPWDEVMDDNLARVIETQDTVILGRATYDEWANFWPTSTIEPFATFINGVEKVVVSSTTPDATWSPVRVVRTGLRGLQDELSDLKQRAGGDIGVHGSITLCRSMIDAGLVDELRLVVAPALCGGGRRLFDTNTTSALTLTRSVTSPSGHLLLDYHVAR